MLYYTYDGIIAIALILNASIADLQRLDPPRRLEDFSYSDDEMARVILKHADNLDFTGLLVNSLLLLMFLHNSNSLKAQDTFGNCDR